MATIGQPQQNSGAVATTTNEMNEIDESAERDRRTAARTRNLLAAGAGLGLILATAGILEPAPSARGMPEDAAALVNGATIRTSSFERALAAVARDAREPLDETDRTRILDRLIEEELLVQRAIDLGLDRSDPIVRNTLVSAMIETIVDGVGPSEPSADEVSAFYVENRDFFARSDRIWVRQLRFPVRHPDDPQSEAEARARAQRAAERLRNGDSMEELAREQEDGFAVPLPDGYLPEAKLREYLGPTPAARAATMQTGEVSEPVRGGSAFHVLQLVDRVSHPPQPLAAVEAQVRAEFRRRAGDRSLRTYLDRLRDAASIRLATP